MSIKSIEIENFRSHKNTFVEFSPNVNIIIGENDSGKTNILRALNWTINNRPSGDDMRSFWEGNTVVKIDIDDIIIERVRTNSENIYKMNNEVYKAFGQGVPEQISNFINMNSDNIAFQLDGPFLLGLSAADVGKHYNKIVRLDIIDEVISNIKKTLKSEENELLFVQKESKLLEDNLKQYEWINEAQQNLGMLEKMQIKVQRLQREIIDIELLKNKYEKLNIAKQENEKILNYETKVNELIKGNEQIGIKKNEYFILASLIDKLKKLKQRQVQTIEIIKYEKKVKKLIDDYEIVEKTKQYLFLLQILHDKLKLFKDKRIKILKKLEFESIISQLIVKEEQIKIAKDDLQNIQNLIDRLQLLTQKSKEIKKQISKFEEIYKQQLPEICPILEIACPKLMEEKKK